MTRHLDLMVEIFGEESGCRQFRKVALQYSTRFGPSKEFDKRVVKLRHRAEFDELEHVELAGPAAAWPRAAALLELAAPRVEREEFCAPWELEPLYLRASDAEIEWDRRATS